MEKGVVGGCVSRPLPAEAPAGAYAHTRRRTEKKNRLTLEGQSKRTEHMQAHIDPLEQISVISPQRQLKFTLAKAMRRQPI